MNIDPRQSLKPSHFYPNKFCKHASGRYDAQVPSCVTRSLSAREHPELHISLAKCHCHVSKESKNCARKWTKHVSNADMTCHENATKTCDVKNGTSFSSKGRSSTSKKTPTMLVVLGAWTTSDGTLTKIGRLHCCDTKIGRLHCCDTKKMNEK